MSPTQPPPNTSSIRRAASSRASCSAAVRYTELAPVLDPQKMQTRRRLMNGLFGELVAETVNGEDVLRMPGIVFELLPEPRHVHVHRPRGGHGVVAPDLIQQLVARQGGSAVLEKVAQQLELERRQFDR